MSESTKKPMKLNKAQLHVIFSALDDAVDWQESLADCNKNFVPKDYRKAKDRAAVYANLRDQIGRNLRGEM